jgi:hypothetical protein
VPQLQRRKRHAEQERDPSLWDLVIPAILDHTAGLT